MHFDRHLGAAHSNLWSKYSYVGPPLDNPEITPLAVLHLNNWQYIMNDNFCEQVKVHLDMGFDNAS